MAWGAGGFTAYNKVLPGTYINYISLSSASVAASERGTAALGLELPWGEEGKILRLTTEELTGQSQTLFGCDATSEALRPLREALLNASTVLCYRLNGGGTKASCTLATAKYSGTAGNRLRLTVEADADEPTDYVVKTYLDAALVDTQTVSTAAELTDNDYLSFVTTGSLTENAGLALTGGTDGEVTAASHQQFLNLLEAESFDTLGYAGTQEEIKRLYAQYTTRLRENGAKFQTVLYQFAADHEGVVNVGNACEGENPAALVYWVTGLCAGTAANETAFNAVYDGEYTVSANLTMTDLEERIRTGVFTLHKVGSELRVLKDCNSLVNLTAEKGEVFRDNRTIRVLDGIAKDTASLFMTSYMGKIPNTAAGRSALRADMVKLLRSLYESGAIDNFETDDVTVKTGEDKTSVIVSVAVEIPGAMEKLYMTCIVA